MVENPPSVYRELSGFYKTALVTDVVVRQYQGKANEFPEMIATLYAPILDIIGTPQFQRGVRRIIFGLGLDLRKW